ncbi:PqqD family peptide modification chaperone [Paenarthrobacter sp. NPDC018779]|uniref:PqqD family peptide modification chaperone n=1 Tax=Paenarthrobacter sp. NPDC018779 TaxID=3364375 RepID=UPI0037C9F14B
MRTGDFTVDALGGHVRIRLDFADHAFDEQRFREFEEPWRDASPHSNEASADVVNPVAELVWRFPDAAGTPGSIAELSTYATLAAIESKRGRLLMLHAAGIADASGEVLAFIGPSGKGKTTLARTLGSDYGYVTDETVGIDSDGAVHPYRKPLSVLRSGKAFKDQLAPSALGLRELPDAPLHLGGLVVVDRDEDFAGPPRIVTLGLCEALAAIVPEASYLADMDKPLQNIARHVDRSGAIQQVTYRDATQVLPLVPELLSRVEPGEWAAVMPSGSAGVRSPFADETFVPSFVLDAVEADGQTAVLDANRVVHVLDGVGPLVWRTLSDGFDFEAILQEVQQEFGAPPEQSLDAAVVDVLIAFADAGLVLRLPEPHA